MILVKYHPREEKKRKGKKKIFGPQMPVASASGDPSIQ
jgi:hypothetical protein